MKFNLKKNKSLEANNLPRHIGIIMDGNGRWAKKRGLPRKAGHSQGTKTFKACVDDLIELGIECATFYTLSTENWTRPKDEIDAILKLFERYLDDLNEMSQKNVKLMFIGDLSVFTDSLREKIKNSSEATKNNTGLKCVIAVNYGGRAEILNAVKKYAEDYTSFEKIPELNEKYFNNYLYTTGLPDVDLIIRPSGEQRTSNFLIWQAAYAELVFMDILWPDFKKKHLIKAINEYCGRNRRFGGI